MVEKYKSLNDKAKEYLVVELKKRTEDNEVLNRCYKEINTLYDDGLLFIVQYLYMYKQSNVEVDYYFRGMVNNLLLLFILGLSQVDPIKYNLPSELCYNCSMYIDFDNGTYKDFLSYLEVNGTDFKTVSCTCGKYIIIPKRHNYYRVTDIYFRLYESGEFVTSDDYKTYEDDYLIIFLSNKRETFDGSVKNTTLNSKNTKQIINVINPKDFNDFVKVVSMVRSTDVWENNQDALFKSGKIDINSIISNREDIYHYLTSHNFSSDDSLKIVTFIRKGHSSRNNDCWKDKWDNYKRIMAEHNCEDWFIDACSKIKYLYGRGQAISDCIYYDKLNILH